MYDVGNWINQSAPANQIYLAPLWSQQGTLMLVTRNTKGFRADWEGIRVPYEL
jgi:hypothetical protein